MIRSGVLAARLIRGGGRAGVARLLFLILGVAMAVTASLIALAVPRGLDADHARADARAVMVSPPGTPGSFRFRVVEDSYRGRPWTRVLIARGTSPVQLPPGVDQLPFPGQVFTSPTIAAAAKTDAGLRQRLSAPVSGLIGDSGLEGPDDQFSYVGVTEEQLGDKSIDGAGFGGQHSPPTGLRNVIAVALAMIVGVPALLFLSTCSRLSAATRARRLAALRLLGMRRAQVLAICGWETGLGALLGALLGSTAFLAVNVPLARSGVVGTKWFPGDTRLSLIGVMVVSSGVAAIATCLAVAGTRRVLRGPLEVRHNAVAGASSWWRLLPLLVGISALIAFLASSIGKQGFSSSGQNTTVLATSLASVGVIVALRPMVGAVAAQLLRVDSVSVRLGVRRLQYEPTSVLSVLTGLVVLVLVAGISAGVLQDATLTASPQGDNLLLQIDAREIVPDARNSVATLGGRQAVAAVQTSRSGPPEVAPPTLENEPAVRGFTVLYASCDGLRGLVNARLAGCEDYSAFRLRDPEDPDTALPPGATGTLKTDTGELLPVIAPALVLDVLGLAKSPVPNDTVVFTHPAAPPGGWPASSSFLYTTPRTPVAIAELQDELARTAPLAQVFLNGGSLENLSKYTMLRRTLLLGAGLGFMLGLMSFAVACADRALERRPAIATLVVLGVPVRMLRAVQRVQLLVPLAIGLSAAVAVGSLGAAGYLRAGGLQRGWYTGSTLAALALAAVGIAAGLASALVVLGRRPRTESLRRE